MGRNRTEQEWRELDAATRDQVGNAASETEAWSSVTRSARVVLRNYSTSFFIVTRFLLARKREQVIYAAVRYPDEVVNTFPLSSTARLGLLAGFSEVVKPKKIPPDYYHSFLDAMEADSDPREFEHLDDLIDSYISGSAVVVGYFLAPVYKAVSRHVLAASAGLSGWFVKQPVAIIGASAGRDRLCDSGASRLTAETQVAAGEPPQRSVRQLRSRPASPPRTASIAAGTEETVRPRRP
jgi:hypothetical protein